jgi:aconitase A
MKSEPRGPFRQLRFIQPFEEGARRPYREGWLKTVAFQGSNEVQDKIERLGARRKAMHLGTDGLGAGCEAFKGCGHSCFQIYGA